MGKLWRTDAATARLPDHGQSLYLVAVQYNCHKSRWPRWLQVLALVVILGTGLVSHVQAAPVEGSVAADAPIDVKPVGKGFYIVENGGQGFMVQAKVASAARLSARILKAGKRTFYEVTDRQATPYQTWVVSASNHKVLWSGQSGALDEDGETERRVVVRPTGVGAEETSSAAVDCAGRRLALTWNAFEDGATASDNDEWQRARAAAVAGDTYAMPTAAMEAFRLTAVNGLAPGDSLRFARAPGEVDDGDPDTSWLAPLRKGWPLVFVLRAQDTGFLSTGIRVGVSGAVQGEAIMTVRTYGGSAPPFNAGPWLLPITPSAPQASYFKWKGPVPAQCVEVTIFPGGSQVRVHDLQVATTMDQGDPAELVAQWVRTARRCGPVFEAASRAQPAAMAKALAIAFSDQTPPSPAPCFAPLIAKLPREAIGDAGGLDKVISDRWLAGVEEDPALIGSLGTRGTGLFARVIRDANRSAPMRHRAAMALALSSDEAGWKTLIEVAMREDGNVTKPALETLPPEAHALLVAHLGAREIDCAHTARFLNQTTTILSRLQTDDLANQALAALSTFFADEPGPLSDEGFRCQYAALRAIGEIRAGHAGALLESQVLHNPEPVLRSLALRTRCARIDSPVTPALVEAGLRDANPAVRQAAAKCVAHTTSAFPGTPTARFNEALARALEKEPWPFVQVSILDALGASCLGTRDAQKLLLGRVSSGAVAPRRAALRALVSCRHPGAGRVLLRMMAGRWPTALRQEAATQLRRWARMGGRLNPGPERATLVRIVDQQIAAAQSQAGPEAFADDALVALAFFDPAVALAKAEVAIQLQNDFAKAAGIETLTILCRDETVGPRGREHLRRLTTATSPVIRAAARGALTSCE